MSKSALMEYIANRSCAVLGLGVSNLPLVQRLCREGVRVTVYDRHTPEELGGAALSLAASGVRFAVADKDFSDIREALIFRSPGIRPDVVGIRMAVARGAELCSEIELFMRITSARMYAITGSDGKTTSTTLTGRILEKICGTSGGHAFVGGNIGTPLLCKSDSMTARDMCALELSSFQLMAGITSPSRAAITNVSPNHLDWHTSMNEYIEAKCNIVGNGTERLVTNADCDLTKAIAKRVVAQREKTRLFLFSSAEHSFDRIFDGIEARQGDIALYVSDGYICADDGKGVRRLLAVSEINVPGKHNIENFMTAIGLTLGDTPTNTYSEVAREFFGVEHRLELVREARGVRYYNSSIDSSPSRTAAALSAMSDKSLVLICGGYDKKIPYAPLAKAICEHGGVKAVSLTGDTGKRIGEEIEMYASQHPNKKAPRYEYHADFFSAVDFARECATKGDCVLLSPASASFDAFKNFAERGNKFKDYVQRL